MARPRKRHALPGVFGDNVEVGFGQSTFLVFYLLCGLAATGARLLFTASSSIPNLGASGAIAGVLGAFLLLFPQGQVRVLQGQRVVPVPADGHRALVHSACCWVALARCSASTNWGGVAYMAHIGGFWPVLNSRLPF